MTIDSNGPGKAPVDPSVFPDMEIPVGASATDKALGEYIFDKVKDGLSPAEKTAIEAFIEGAMSSPALPAPDKELIGKWLDMVKNARTISDAAATGTDAATTVENPYMRPGIMAILAPVMAKLMPIMIDIIKSSAKLEIAMQGLMLEMAKASYTAAINVGEAKAKQLEIDRDKNIAAACIAFVSAGVNIGMSAGLAAQKTKVAEGKGGIGGLNKTQKEEYQASFATNPKTGNMEKTQESRQILKEARDDLRTREQTFTSVMGSLGQGGQSTIEAAAADAKIELTKEEAMQNALKEFFDKMVQTLQTTAQKAGEEQKSADQAWQSFSSLYRDFGKLVTDIWRA